MKSKTTCRFIPLPFNLRKKKRKVQTGDQMQNGGRERRGQGKREVHKNYVNSRGVKRRKREMKRNYIVKIPFHLTQRRTEVQLCPAHYFLRIHGVPLSLYSLLFFLHPPLPLSHPASGVTAIYFTSDPLYDCSRFAFMLDGLPKRLSDKAMNTLSGFSLLVSLRSAGQWCWY